MLHTPQKLKMVRTRKRFHEDAHDYGDGTKSEPPPKITTPASPKSTSSSIAARRAKLELEAARAKAQIEKELIDKELALKITELQDGSIKSNMSDRHSVIQDWLDKSQQEGQHAHDHGKTTGMQMASKEIDNEDGFSKLANAINSLKINNTDPGLLGRICTPRELPHFSGDPMEWLQFLHSYNESTEICKFSDVENMWRLRKSLHGPAREAVSALLISVTSPQTVMSTLELLYGNPELIISKIMVNIKKLNPISHDYHKDILGFSVKIQNYVATIKALGKFDYLQGRDVTSNILGKLPAVLIAKWVDYSQPFIIKGNPQLEILSTFLYDEAKKVSMCSVNLINYKFDYHSNKRRENVNVHKSSVFFQAEMPLKCKFCHLGKHLLTDCKLFRRSLRKNRWLFVKHNGICYKCLVSDHKRDTCTAPLCNVEECGLPHHSLLHYYLPKNTTENNVNNELLQSNTNNEVVSNVNINTCNVMLKIVPIKIYGSNGKIINTTALLDDGSTISLINSNLASELGLTGTKRCMRISGAWQNSEINCSADILNIKFSNMCDELFQCELYSVSDLNIPFQNIPYINCKLYKHLYDMKCMFNQGLTKPQVLIGQDNYHLIMPLETKVGKPNEPCATLTPLGWCIHGRVPSGSYRFDKINNNKTVLFLKSNLCSNDNYILNDMHKMIKNSFSLDAIGIMPKQRQNPDDVSAQNQLEETARLVDGRWEVGLPWKNKNCILPDSFPTALKRLKSVENKIIMNKEYGERYKGRINHLFQNNYAYKVNNEDSSQRIWYLPHFGVDNPNKKKLRLVFDAAARSNGVCLNDFLLKGPDLLASLLGIMFRFRIHKVAVTGDIKDMFLRIKIRDEDQNALRFLWRHQPKDCVSIYAMSSLIFGANCSPFIAQYIKNKNAKQYEMSMPSAAKAICDQHFMDDYIDSLPNDAIAIKLIKQIIFIHKQGGFNICNWTTNSKAVLNSLPKDIISSSAVNLTIDNEHSERTLGLLWYPSDDTLRFDLSFKKISQDIISGKQKPTKREMLRIIMSVFDVYGFLSPFTINGKIMLQDTWRLKINWDDYITDEIHVKWCKWLKQLKVIGNIKLSRCYQMAGGERGSNKQGDKLDAFLTDGTMMDGSYDMDVIYKNLELHVFCDASTKAMCAVAYWRWVQNGQIMVAFIASKSRVAPLKPATVPRLELQAALLAARLARTIMDEHKCTPCQRVFWCDSTTVLHWIYNNKRLYKTYEANRLAEIDDITKCNEWRYVPTSLNVADIATRENYDCTLLTNEWIQGPQFLYMDETDWPEKKIIFGNLPQEVELINMMDNKLINMELPTPDVTRFSSWLRLLRATAAVLKFINKCRKCYMDESTVLKYAERLLILKSQQESFQEEIKMLKNNVNISKNSRILTLSPYLDENGVLRVGGRIDAARSVNPEMKIPIILDGKSYVAKLIVRYYHVNCAHGHQEMVVNELKQRYWILRMRSTVKQITSKCMFCRMRKAKPVAPRMGDLPEARVAHHQRPFTYCGVDLFGPMEVTVARHREKRYGVLFTCLTVRAIHVEVVYTLTSDSLIMALRRMAARRGWPLYLYSDNGTNLRGANTELKSSLQALDEDKLKQEAVNKGTTWMFIPAASPHWGGAWERMIRTVKSSLKVVLKQRAPKDETLLTLLAEVENIVNSRPLTHVSVEPSSTEALTPNHFLLGSSNNLPQIGVFNDSDVYLRKQWRISQWLADMFWKRWVKEVLPVMLPRRKWMSDSGPPLKVGDLVFVVDPDAPRNVWPRGVVVEVLPGKDGRVRMVRVKTRTGVLNRAAIRVARIPIGN